MELFLGFVKAFLVGGVLCAVGQILIDRTKLTPARILTAYVVIGVILGTTLGRLGSTLLGAPGWPSVSIVLIAVGFSMGIGVFFGYYPANKAAKLDPIEALRYE